MSGIDVKPILLISKKDQTIKSLIESAKVGLIKALNYEEIYEERKEWDDSVDWEKISSVEIYFDWIFEVENARPRQTSYEVGKVTETEIWEVRKGETVILLFSLEYNHVLHVLVENNKTELDSCTIIKAFPGYVEVYS